MKKNNWCSSMAVMFMPKMLGENELDFHFWQNSKQYIYKSNARALESLAIKVYYANLSTE
jgi:hypothetical protein